MIRINQLTLPVDHGEEAIKKKAANQNIRAEGSRPYAYPEH